MSTPLRAALGMFVLLLTFTLSAQKPVVEISPEIKLPKSKDFREHLYSDQNNHYVYFYDGGSRTAFGGYRDITLILEKYDNRFKEVFSKEYQVDRKNLSSLGVKYFQGRFAWLISENNKKEDYLRYSIVPIGTDGKQAKIIDIAKIKYDDKDDIPGVEWAVSKDSSKIMFKALADDDRDDVKVKVFMAILGKDLTAEWSQKFVLPYTEERIKVMSTTLKNDGSVYILAKLYEDDKARESKRNDKKKKVAAYDMMLFRFEKGSETPKEFKLKLGDSFIRSASLTTDKNDGLRCAGFYSNTSGGALQGVFYLEIGEDGTPKVASKKAFADADVAMLGKKNTQKDKGGDIGIDSDFKFSDFLIRDDGSAVVVAEENYTEMVSYYNAATRSYSYRYYYYSNDIITFSMATSGEIERITILPKYQMGTDTKFFLSHTVLLRGNDIYFIYNEDEDNLDKPVSNPKPKLMNNFKECVTVMTVLHPDGKMERKQLFEAKDVESLFVPEDSRQCAPNRLFFTSFRAKLFAKSNFRMGTVTVP